MREQIEQNENYIYKPDVKYTYKPSVGKYRYQDRTTKENHDVDVVSIHVACVRYAYIGEDEQGFNLLSQPTTTPWLPSPVTAFPPKQDDDSKRLKPRRCGIGKFIKADETVSGKPEDKGFYINGLKSNMRCYPIVYGVDIETQASVSIHIPGTAGLDLSIGDPLKVGLFNNANTLIFSAEKNLTRTGKGAKIKDIYLVSLNDINPKDPVNQASLDFIVSALAKQAGEYESQSKPTRDEPELTRPDYKDLDDDNYDFIPADAAPVSTDKPLSTYQITQIMKIAQSSTGADGLGLPLPRWTPPQVLNEATRLGFKSLSTVPAKSFNALMQHFIDNQAGTKNTL